MAQTISLRMPDETISMVEQYVTETGRTRSDFINEAVREKLARAGAAAVADWAENTDEGRQVYAAMLAASERSWAGLDQAA